ncbi:hypothetical protein HDU76_005813, partial [Blyttiomyces sp. JEL0837]
MSSRVMKCSEVEKTGLVVVSVGVGVSHRDELKVDCRGSLLDSTCRVNWLKSLTKASLTASVLSTAKDSGGEPSLTLTKSMLASRLASAALKCGYDCTPTLNDGSTESGGYLDLSKEKSDAFDSPPSYNALWFVDVPSGSDLGKREISDFIRCRIGGGNVSFQFLMASATTGLAGAPALPSIPAAIQADQRKRKSAWPKGSAVAAACRDYIVWFNGKLLDKVTVKLIVTGRENWIAPLYVYHHATANAASSSTSGKGGDVNKVQTQQGSVDGGQMSVESVPPPPVNVFEVLETGDPKAEIVMEIAPPIAPSAPVEPSAKKKGKEAKKAAADAVISTTTTKIEDPLKKAAPPNQCNHPGCKEKTSILGVLCEFCNRKFCMTHRLPEVHSQKCAEAKKASSKSTFRNDATLGIALSNKPGQSGGVKSIAKEREDAKKRLKEKIEKARGGSGSG